MFFVDMHSKLNRGFTVIELLVVMAVMGIITTILVSGFPRFGELLVLENQTQLIALAIRDIEQRAVSTLESPIGLPGQYQAPFGVHFNRADPRSYRLFSDAITQDNFFTAGEEVEIVPIERGVYIHRICKLNSADACDINIGDLEQLSVTYKRPNPIIEMRGATVTSCNPGPCTISPLGAGSYAIEIKSKDGSLARRVIMWTTGAVAIKKVP